MTDTLSLLRSHRSVRKFKSDPIPDALLSHILNSARQAPTSSNLQAYSIIVVTDKEKKKSLSHFCGDQAWVANCPVFLVMCPDLHRIEQVCCLRGYKMTDQYLEISIVAIVDTTLVAENIAVACESSGLGICMIGGIRNNPGQVCDLLKLPEKVFPLMGICIGYPDANPMVKPRLLPEMVIHHNEYQEDNFVSLLAEYDKLIKATGLYDGAGRMLAAPDGRTLSTEDYSWSEHTSRRAATTNANTLRIHMREFLESRKFGLK
jgi:nitroreductase